MGISNKNNSSHQQLTVEFKGQTIKVNLGGGKKKPHITAIHINTSATTKS
jgi:hypothetical protein